MKFFLLFIMAIMLSSCSNLYYKDISNNLAEIRESLWEGESEDFSVSLICGQREEDYVINGIATKLIDFGVITLSLKNSDMLLDDSVKYRLIASNEYSGVFEKNPFDGTFVADIKSIIYDDIVSLVVYISENPITINLTKVSNTWKINAESVLKIISKQDKEKLKTFYNGNKFNGEVYIKMINDSTEYKGYYYWYVNIVATDGSSYSMIVSKDTGEILAVNYKSLK